MHSHIGYTNLSGPLAGKLWKADHLLQRLISAVPLCFLVHQGRCVLDLMRNLGVTTTGPADCSLAAGA